MTFAFAGSAGSQEIDENALSASATDGGVRYFEVIEDGVALMAGPSTTAGVATMTPRGTRLTNLGCTQNDAALWCETALLERGVRGFVSVSKIQPVTGADGRPLKGPDNSKMRARKKDFDAVEQIKCAQVEGENLGNCTVQVARAGGGDATAVVTFSNGFTRELYFQLGNFIRANATMSGVGRDIDWVVQDEIYILRVDDQRFEIPAPYIMGL